MIRLHDVGPFTAQPLMAHRKIAHFAVIAILIPLVMGLAGRVHAGSVPQLEARFLELTQALRAQPAQVLAKLFPETSFPLQSTPLFQTLAVLGMPRFVVHEALTRTAENTLNTLLEKAQAGEVSFDIPPLAVRLADHGYPSVETGEIIAALTFRNFVQPEVAAEAIFRDVLSKELSTLDLRQKVLLNPHVRDIGLSCRATKLTVNGVVQNAYVLVVESASHVLHSVELHLFKELNRWRQSPGTGLFPVLLSTLTGNSAPVDLEPVPVVVWDPKLYEQARVLGMGALLPDGTVPEPTEPELSAWAPILPVLHASIPLDVSMGLDHVVAALWQALLIEEARRWATEVGPCALSSTALGGALHVFLRTGEDGTLFLDAAFYAAAPTHTWRLGSRLAGSVSTIELPEQAFGKVQEVRLVSVATQALKASALVDLSGGFSLLTPEPLYPPFSPYELVIVDGAGREVLKHPLPLGLDGGFVEVVTGHD